ncbi:STAS domain-containing protein [Nonomuraea sp. NPDC050310]|uniref:STAS domain-containing protein n=1 Tax=unclassified Nonomuraea TaxID=2593643 RepID=UPI0033CF6945
MTPLVLDLRPSPAGPVLHPAGEIDATNLDELASALDRALAMGGPVTVELTEVPFLDGRALDLLMSAYVQAVMQGDDLRLASPRPKVRRLLEITGARLPVCEATEVRAA